MNGLIIVDIPDRKIVLCRVGENSKPLVLWRGQEYDAVGDYTQAQIEARVTELLAAQ